MRVILGFSINELEEHLVYNILFSAQQQKAIKEMLSSSSRFKNAVIELLTYRRIVTLDPTESYLYKHENCWEAKLISPFKE
jgi:hypothetical protein